MIMNKEFTEDGCHPKDHTYLILKPDIFIEGSDLTMLISTRRE